MGAKSRRRRPSGSLGALKSRVWASIEYLVDVIGDEDQTHEDRRASCNSLTQAALAYARVMELYEIQKDVNALEEAVKGNGRGH
jgi:hypothetical protein